MLMHFDLPASLRLYFYLLYFSQQTKRWLGTTEVESVIGLLGHLNRIENLSYVTTKFTFTASDIILQPSELLIKFIRSEKLSDALRKKLLDSGVIYFHIVGQLCDQNDMDRLMKLLRFEYNSHLGISLCTRSSVSSIFCL